MSQDLRRWFTELGKALRKYSKRDDVVLATKVFQPMHTGLGGGGLSSKAIIDAIERLPQAHLVQLSEPLKNGRHTQTRAAVAACSRLASNSSAVILRLTARARAVVRIIKGRSESNA